MFFNYQDRRLYTACVFGLFYVAYIYYAEELQGSETLAKELTEPDLLLNAQEFCMRADNDVSLACLCSLVITFSPCGFVFAPLSSTYFTCWVVYKFKGLMNFYKGSACL